MYAQSFLPTSDANMIPLRDVSTFDASAYRGKSLWIIAAHQHPRTLPESWLRQLDSRLVDVRDSSDYSVFQHALLKAGLPFLAAQEFTLESAIAAAKRNDDPALIFLPNISLEEQPDTRFQSRGYRSFIATQLLGYKHAFAVQSQPITELVEKFPSELKRDDFLKQSEELGFRVAMSLAKRQHPGNSALESFFYDLSHTFWPSVHVAGGGVQAALPLCMYAPLCGRVIANKQFLFPRWSNPQYSSISDAVQSQYTTPLVRSAAMKRVIEQNWMDFESAFASPAASIHELDDTPVLHAPSRQFDAIMSAFSTTRERMMQVAISLPHLESNLPFSRGETATRESPTVARWQGKLPMLKLG